LADCDSTILLLFQACGYPVYWKGVVFVAAGGDKNDSLNYSQFSDFW
jgi:hypothetical protein